MAQIQQFDLGKAFDTGVKMNQAANYYDDRNMAIEDRQRGIDKENYGYQRQAEQDQLKQDQFIQKKKQAAQKDLELYITHTNPEDSKFMENSRKFLGYFKDKYSDIDDDIERFEQMPEEELKMFVGNLRSQAGLDVAPKTEQQTIYGPAGETKRVAVEKGKDYTPPEGWSLSKPKGSGMKVYDSQGNLIVDTGGASVGKKTQGTLEGGIASDMSSLQQLGTIENMANDNQDLFTYKSQMGVEKDIIAEKLGMERTPEQKERLKKQQDLFMLTSQAFNTYRKEITGAAASEQELKRLEEDFVNKKMSYTQFAQSVQTLKTKMERGLVLKQNLLKKGVKFNSKEYKSYFDNKGFPVGSEGTEKPDVNTRGAELMKENPKMTSDEVMDLLEAEGY